MLSCKFNFFYVIIRIFELAPFYGRLIIRYKRTSAFSPAANMTKVKVAETVSGI